MFSSRRVAPCVIRHAAGTNIISEYKDIFSKESGSDHKHDKVADDSSAALSLLKTLIDEKKRSIAQESKRKKWDFAASPHVHFGKTLDDTFSAFLAWARVKEDGTKINVTKAFRRLESYAVSGLKTHIVQEMHCSHFSRHRIGCTTRARI